MSLMQWKDDMSVGVNELDEDHKVLMELINELHDAMKERKSKEVMGDVLERLVDYTVKHFNREEEYFKKTNYPDAASHIKEHKDLTDKAVDIQNKYKSGDLLMSMELMEFLKSWLVDHIQGKDKQYTAHLNKAGIV